MKGRPLTLAVHNSANRHVQNKRAHRCARLLLFFAFSEIATVRLPSLFV
jgi:hypothetical protein